MCCYAIESEYFGSFNKEKCTSTQLNFWTPTGKQISVRPIILHVFPPLVLQRRPKFACVPATILKTLFDEQTAQNIVQAISFNYIVASKASTVKNRTHPIDSSNFLWLTTEKNCMVTKLSFWMFVYDSDELVFFRSFSSLGTVFYSFYSQPWPRAARRLKLKKQICLVIYFHTIVRQRKANVYCQLET